MVKNSETKRKMITKEEIERWHLAMAALFKITGKHGWNKTAECLFKANEQFYKKLASKAKSTKTVNDVIAETDDDSGEEEETE
jgi:hypothetical protein